MQTTTINAPNFCAHNKHYMFQTIKIIIRLVQNILKEHSCIAKNKILFIYKSCLIFIRLIEKCTLNLKEFKICSSRTIRNISMVGWATG